MHVITGLGTGGAEGMLERLVGQMELEAVVVSMRDVGPTGLRIQAAGTPVVPLGMRPSIPDPRGVVRLVREIRAFRPDVIQTWMYHADLLGGIAAHIGRRTPVIWNIRQSAVMDSALRRGTVATIRLCAMLSRWLPDRIVSCSRAGAEYHGKQGYARDKLVVIPNGFDTERFRPDSAAPGRLRRELGLAPQTPLVGIIARFDPQKDHRTFVAAAAECARRSEAHFLLCGEGTTADNPALMGWIAEAGLGDRVHLLGRREDVPAIIAGLDVATSTSIQEGFPNVVGEAMASGIPTVVTDVGDSAFLVGPDGIVVPPRDPGALAEAWLSLLRLAPGERQAVGIAARRRIEAHFTLDTIAEQYRRLYAAVVDRADPPRDRPEALAGRAGDASG